MSASTVKTMFVREALAELDSLIEVMSFVRGSDDPQLVGAINTLQGQLGVIEGRLDDANYEDTQADRDFEWVRTRTDAVRGWHASKARKAGAG